MLKGQRKNDDGCKEVRERERERFVDSVLLALKMEEVATAKE